MNASNTLGAIVFLAAGTWLGWTVLRGRAQSLLAAISGQSSGNGGIGGRAPGSSLPTVPHGGSVSGAPFSFTLPDPYNLNAIPTPNVFNGVFNQNAPLNAPGYSGEYGPYSPDYSQAYDPTQFVPQSLAPALQVFNP